jgi:hypothetical protein
VEFVAHADGNAGNPNAGNCNPFYVDAPPAAGVEAAGAAANNPIFCAGFREFGGEFGEIGVDENGDQVEGPGIWGWNLAQPNRVHSMLKKMEWH